MVFHPVHHHQALVPHLLNVPRHHPLLHHRQHLALKEELVFVRLIFVPHGLMTINHLLLNQGHHLLLSLVVVLAVVVVVVLVVMVTEGVLVVIHLGLMLSFKGQVIHHPHPPHHYHRHPRVHPLLVSHLTLPLSFPLHYHYVLDHLLSLHLHLPPRLPMKASHLVTRHLYVHIHH